MCREQTVLSKPTGSFSIILLVLFIDCNSFSDLTSCCTIIFFSSIMSDFILKENLLWDIKTFSSTYIVCKHFDESVCLSASFDTAKRFLTRRSNQILSRERIIRFASFLEKHSINSTSVQHSTVFALIKSNWNLHPFPLPFYHSGSIIMHVHPMVRTGLIE